MGSDLVRAYCKDCGKKQSGKLADGLCRSCKGHRKNRKRAKPFKPVVPL